MVDKPQMAMDDHEIALAYKNAVDKKEQIQILTDLNACDVWTMRCYLIDLGCDVDKRWFWNRNPKHQSFRAREDEYHQQTELARENEALRQQIADLQDHIAALNARKSDIIGDELWYLTGAIDAALRLAGAQIQNGGGYFYKIADQLKELIWAKGGDYQ